MTNQRSAALQYAHENSDRFLEELKDFVAIPSISTDPERKAELQQAADWVAQQLARYRHSKREGDAHWRASGRIW